MAGSRTITALAGLIVGLTISLALTYYLGNVFVLFLFVPFIPFLFQWRRRTGSDGRTDDTGHPNGEQWASDTANRRESRKRHGLRTCPRCGFQTRDREHRYCPRDGTRLE